MVKKLMSTVLLSVVLVTASTGWAQSVTISDFEGNLDGWYADAGTLTFSATGATVGAQALQVDAAGGWKLNAKVDVKGQRATLGKKGAKIIADITAFAADMTTTWMQVEIVINGQNNDDSGANNNIGWVGLGGQDIVRDGQPHAYTWTLPDALTAKIAASDDNIVWFEFALVSNVDGASVAKFYIDNIRVAADVPTASVLVSSFESGLEGWYDDDWTAGTIAVGTTGATAGAQAMQVSGPGGWQQLTKVNAKPQMARLATQGVKITADVTAFAADMTGTWMQVGMVLNCQNTDDAGANNNLGWNDLGLLDVVIDGQPHTLTWVLPDAVTAKVAKADDSIWWFEFLLISNTDGASTAKFYIDNIQVASPVVPTGKSTDLVFGNWEQDLDGWAVGGDADVLYSDANGVTLDNYSLDVWVPTGAWATVLSLNLMDPNNAAILEAFRLNTKITADVTHMVNNWPVDDIPGWNGKHFVVNCGGDGWSLWQDFGYQAGWTRNDGDRTSTATWNYGQYLNRINFDNLTWCSLELIVNANDSSYAGPVWFYIDNMKFSGGGIALNPLPANGAVDVDINTMLDWTAGTFAASHDVYLGIAQAAVNGANKDSNPDVVYGHVDGIRFDPDELAFGTKYYWRVDEVNDANPDSPWKGLVWNFTTANFITVDDFESYTDNLDAGEAIFSTWTDGWGVDENGSQVGYGTSPFAEQTNVHGGRQAMPFEYSNTDKATYSETTREWAAPQDWTRNGFDTLKIYIMGKADNVPDEMYMTIQDEAGKTATMKQTDTAFMKAETWTEWLIPASQFTGVDLTKVVKFTVGVGNKTSVSGAKGALFIDDIRIVLEPYGLVAHYALEGNLQDSSGNGFHGTFGGDPNFPAAFINGPAGFGKGLQFDGTGGHQNVELGTFNPSSATGQLTIAMWAKWDGLSDQWQGLIGKRDGWALNNMMWHLEIGRDSGGIGFARYDSYPSSGGATLPIGTWTHVAVTFNGTTARFYINGNETGSGGFSFGEDTASGLHFGSDDPNGGNAFNGALDEVRIYDKALTAAEVKALLTK